MSIIIVQHVCTTWTKIARGGANAVQRSAVPEAAKLPSERVPSADLVLLLHTLYFYERDFSRPKEEIVSNPAARPLLLGCVTVEPGAEIAIISFKDNGGCGAPERKWAHKTIHIAHNEWGQIIYNGRFVGEDYWWYEKHVVNVGVFERLTSSLFTRSAPTYRFEAMEELF